MIKMKRDGKFLTTRPHREKMLKTQDQPRRTTNPEGAKQMKKKGASLA